MLYLWLLVVVFISSSIALGVIDDIASCKTDDGKRIEAKKLVFFTLVKEQLWLIDGTFKWEIFGNNLLIFRMFEHYKGLI